MDHVPTEKQCEEAASKALEAIRDFMEAEGISGRYLAKKLKRELNAYEQKPFCNESTGGLVVMSPKMIAWDIRQKARQDAHNLRRDYPEQSQKVEHSGDVKLTVVYEEPDKGGNGHSGIQDSSI